MWPTFPGSGVHAWGVPRRAGFTKMVQARTKTSRLKLARWPELIVNLVPDLVLLSDHVITRRTCKVRKKIEVQKSLLTRDSSVLGTG